MGVDKDNTPDEQLETQPLTAEEKTIVHLSQEDVKAIVDQEKPESNSLLIEIQSRLESLEKELAKETKARAAAEKKVLLQNLANKISASLEVLELAIKPEDKINLEGTPTINNIPFKDFFEKHFKPLLPALFPQASTPTTLPSGSNTPKAKNNENPLTSFFKSRYPIDKYLGDKKDG